MNHSHRETGTTMGFSILDCAHSLYFNCTKGKISHLFPVSFNHALIAAIKGTCEAAKVSNLATQTSASNIIEW